MGTRAGARVTARCDRVVAELNADWDHLRHDREQVGSWMGRHPVLTGCADLGQVLRAVAERPDPVLAALLSESAAGSETAARVVLQAMLGKVTLMASRDVSAGVGDYVSVMWDCIRSYPLSRRPRRIAANLALDTYKIVLRESRIAAQVALWPREEAIAQALDHQVRRDLLDHAAEIGRLTAAGVVQAAEQLGLVDGPTSALLHTVYDEGLSSSEAGRRHAMSATTVRRRCSRAVRELARHADDLAEAG